MQFTLQENSGSVSGSGSLSSAEEAIAVQVSGTYTEPNVALTLTASGFEPISISAVVSETSLTGTANGSGFVSSAVSMTRQ
ncbi:MAG: hypothetical protein M3Q37_01500 [Gemmatimonadota bacterium]|nr:hypothetical protein [Gemmatimonadota bacterium]